MWAWPAPHQGPVTTDEVKTFRRRVPPLDACPPTTTPDRHYGATPPTRGRAVKNPPLDRVLNSRLPLRKRGVRCREWGEVKRLQVSSGVYAQYTTSASGPSTWHPGANLADLPTDLKLAEYR